MASRRYNRNTRQTGAKNRTWIPLLFALIMVGIFMPSLLEESDRNQVSQTPSGTVETIPDESYDIPAAASPYDTDTDTNPYDADSYDTSTDSNSYSTETDSYETDTYSDTNAYSVTENGSYTSKEDVALYLHTYGHLPDNFITKAQARELGWSGGSLEPYAPGKCIGGDYFGNYEGALPSGSYHECDIDTLRAKSRGAKRIVYSADGDIYYTGDHYETFERLYGEP